MPPSASFSRSFQARSTRSFRLRSPISRSSSAMWGGSQQVDLAGLNHIGHRTDVRDVRDYPPVVDARLPHSYGRYVQSVRLHHRHLGRWVREATTRAIADRHASNLSGGSFYSISMLPPVWRTITLANPVVYLVSGFRWSFYGSSDVSVGVSLCMTTAFLLLCWRLCGGSSRQDTGSEPDRCERCPIGRGRQPQVPGDRGWEQAELIQ